MPQPTGSESLSRVAAANLGFFERLAAYSMTSRLTTREINREAALSGHRSSLGGIMVKRWLAEELTRPIEVIIGRKVTTGEYIDWVDRSLLLSLSVIQLAIATGATASIVAAIPILAAIGAVPALSVAHYLLEEGRPAVEKFILRQHPETVTQIEASVQSKFEQYALARARAQSVGMVEAQRGLSNFKRVANYLTHTDAINALNKKRESSRLTFSDNLKLFGHTLSKRGEERVKDIHLENINRGRNIVIGMGLLAGGLAAFGVYDGVASGNLGEAAKCAALVDASLAVSAIAFGLGNPHKVINRLSTNTAAALGKVVRVAAAPLALIKL